MNSVHPGIVATELGRHTGLHQSPFSSSVLSEYSSSVKILKLEKPMNAYLMHNNATFSLGCLSSDMQHWSAR